MIKQLRIRILHQIKRQYKKSEEIMYVVVHTYDFWSLIFENGYPGEYEICLHT